MGIELFDEFKRSLSDIMIPCIHKRVLLYGYGYTGRFLRWYAKYYHSIEVDYVVAENLPYSQGYDAEVFLPTIFMFDYKDVKDCVVWLAVPQTDEIRALMRQQGYVENQTYFDFYKTIYGDDVVGEEIPADVFHKKKSGRRDIQFLEWLEWKYDCNFVTAVDVPDFTVAKSVAHSYRVTTGRELYGILDKAHCKPKSDDKIFDFGCGKGGSIVSFLDYGFEFAGGVEYEPGLYDVLVDNITKLDLLKCTECIYGNAADIKDELDKYNWFYFFDPFNIDIFRAVIKNIEDSYHRYPRKMKIIYINCHVEKELESSEIFIMTNKFTVDMRNRVVGIFETGDGKSNRTF